MKRGITYLLVVLLAGVAAVAAGPNAEEWADSIVALPSISVTSMKSGCDMRHQSISVTEFTRRDIDNSRIVDLHRVSDQVPNFYMPRYGSRITSSMYVRGIGARIDQPAVGLTVDNVPILNKDNYDFDLDDIVGIDMLHGPQNTMYGRNSMSGLINIVTMSPLDWDGVKLRVEGGPYGYYKANAALYHMHSNRVGVGAGVTVGGNDGYWKNSYNGRHVGGEKQWSAWYKMAWHPSGSWNVINTGRFYHNSQSGYPYESYQTHLVAYNDTCFYNRDSWIDGLTVAWSHGPWSATSVTSVQHIDDNMTLDQDFTTLSYFTLTQRRRETAVTQDFMLRRQGDIYDWTIGASGYTRHTSMRAPVTFLPYGIEHLVEEKRNEMNPQYPIVWDEDSFVLNSDFSHPTYGLGVYHRSVLKLGRWNIEGSLRLDMERPSLRYRSYMASSYTVYDKTVPGETSIYDRKPINLDETGRLSHTYTRLLPKVSMMYELPAVSGDVYASFSQGYKSGGYNTQMFSDFLQQRLMSTMGLSSPYDVDDIISYKPEYSFNYEVGCHTSFFDGTLEADASVFYIDCRDQQLTRFPAGLTTGRIMDNAGRTRSVGCEVTARWHPNRHWSVTAAWGHADARFEEYNDGKADYRHCHVPYAPVNTVNAAIYYETSLPGVHVDRLVVGATTRGVGTIYWNEDNSARQPLYATLGLSVAATSGMFTLRGWLDNITNTRYSTFYFKSIGNEFLQRGLPLTGGVSISMDIDLHRQ